MLSLEIDDLCFFGNGLLLDGTDGLDCVAIDKHKTGRVCWSGDGVHHGIGE